MSAFLIKLVHSLSKGEKRYFRQFAGSQVQNPSKNYLKIYNVLIQSKSTALHELSALIKNTTASKHLQSETLYLKDKILWSLYNYQIQSSKRNQIQKGILLAEVLTNKGFQTEAIKKLKTIKKTAEKYEELTMLLSIIELEEKMLFKEGIIGYKDKLQDLKTERNILVNKIQNLNEYLILREELREIQFSEQLLTNDTKSLSTLYNNPLVLDNSNCLTLKAQDHWFYTQVLSNYLLRNFTDGLNHSMEYVKFLFTHRHLFNSQKLLPAISNLLFHAALTRTKPSFNMGLHYLESATKNNHVASQYVKYIRYTRYLEFGYYTDDLIITEEYQALTADLLKGNIGQFEDAQIQYLYMVVVRAQIILNRYKQASKWVNLWIRHGVLSYRKVQAVLFSLMIHYKLGYWELIESELPKLKALEKTHKREQKLITAFHEFFKQRINESKPQTESISQLQATLLAISIANPGYYDFISYNYHQWSLDFESGMAL